MILYVLYLTINEEIYRQEARKKIIQRLSNPEISYLGLQTYVYSRIFGGRRRKAISAIETKNLLSLDLHFAEENVEILQRKQANDSSESIQDRNFIFLLVFVKTIELTLK